jgi:hypothetical protein
MYASMTEYSRFFHTAPGERKRGERRRKRGEREEKERERGRKRATSGVEFYLLYHRILSLTIGALLFIQSLG